MRFDRTRRYGFVWLTVVISALILSACGEPGAALGGNSGPTAGSAAQDAAAKPPEAATAKAPSTTTTSTTAAPTTVRFAGSDYICEDGAGNEWLCENDSGSVAYCNGAIEPTDCSPRWYPNDLANLDLVDFDGVSYACESIGPNCVAYKSGPPPTSFLMADVWCDSLECSYYDPDEWFELVDGTDRFFCQDALAGFQKFDCMTAVGDRPPTVITQPSIYCSGGEYLPDCSDLWYPSDLLYETIVTFNGGTYLCDTAITGDFGDYDCGSYTGGDPAFVSTGQLKCSNMPAGFECALDEYPSALVGVYFATIGYMDHVCESTYQGSECWAYFTGSVRNAMFGPPDYYCNSYGECETYGYP